MSAGSRGAMSSSTSRRVTCCGSTAAQELKRKIEDRSLALGVLGLGYVGLPLALAFAAVAAGADLLGLNFVPTSPRYLAHIPGEPGLAESGGAQMVRVCDGKALPKGDRNAVYMLRTFGGEAHEIWNVADPANPVLVAAALLASGLTGRDHGAGVVAQPARQATRFSRM